MLALRELPLHQSNSAHDAMTLGVIRIDAHRLFDQLYGLLDSLWRAGLVLRADGLPDRAGLPRVSRCEAWVQRDRLIEMGIRLAIGIGRFQVMVVLALKQMIIRIQRTAGFTTSLVERCRLDSFRQNRNNASCQFVLDGKQILQMAIVALRPK